MAISSVLKDSADSDLADVRQLFKEFGCASVRNDVSEVYSPPRVIAMAARMGLKPGFALDLTVVDPDDGRPWDFDCVDKRAKALARRRLYDDPSLGVLAVLVDVGRERRGLNERAAPHAALIGATMPRLLAPGVERTAVTWAALLSLSVMVMHVSTVLLSEVRPPTCAPNGYQGNPRPLSPPRHPCL